MTREEIYKASDVLNTILDNYLHGGEAAEVVTKFEDKLIKSNLMKEEFVSNSETVEAQNKEVYMKPHSEPIYLGIGGIPINAPKYPCKEEPKECVYSKDDYTDEDRKVLCDGCEEECKYSKKEEPISEDLDREITKLHLHFPNIDMLTFEEIARHFAEWSKVNSMRILLTKDKDK